MNKIIKNEDNELTLSTKWGSQTIHLIHCSETLEEIKQDVATPYIVAEEATNYPRLHLVTDFSEDEALQQVDNYLREQENQEESHLITVFEVKL
jgi:hypothetical protein